MFTKKHFVLVLTLLILGIFASPAPAAQPAVFLNGQQLSFDVAPVIDNGRTLVPLRAIFESLGAEVAWDQDTSTVTATRGDTNIRLQIGNTTAYKNGVGVTFDVPGQLGRPRAASCPISALLPASHRVQMSATLRPASSVRGRDILPTGII